METPIKGDMGTLTDLGIITYHYKLKAFPKLTTLLKPVSERSDYVATFGPNLRGKITYVHYPYREREIRTRVICFVTADPEKNFLMVNSNSWDASHRGVYSYDVSEFQEE